MPLVLAGATSGSTTLTPTDAVTTTLTLPSTTGTLLSTANPQSGGVIQVVQGTQSTNASTSSSSYVTTGLTASITPKFSTSKILILLAGGDMDSQASNRQIQCTIYRNASNLSGANGFENAFATSSRIIVPNSAAYLDSPSTTSSTSYTVYFKGDGSGVVYFNSQGGTASITLIEVAA
jgi:hypothetical protein